MVAVVFVGPVGGVDDVGIRGGGRQRMIFDIELNGRAWGLQPEDLQVAPPQPFPVEEPFAHLSSKSCCGRFGGTWAAAAQLRHGAASEAGGRATGRVIVLTTHVKIP